MKICVLSRLLVPTIDEVPRRAVEGQTIIDFVRVSASRSIAGVYEGLCW